MLKIDLNRAFGYIPLIIIFAIQALPHSTLAGDHHCNRLIKEEFTSLRYSFPISEDWSREKLSDAMLYAQEIGSSAVIVIHDGKLVLEWGRADQRMWSHSVRKSLLSALYGIAVEKGLVDLIIAARPSS